MDFLDIDRERAKAGIDQKVLCVRSTVHPSTYSQIKNGRRGAYVRTINKLRVGLEALIAEQGETHGND